MTPLLYGNQSTHCYTSASLPHGAVLFWRCMHRPAHALTHAAVVLLLLMLVVLVLLVLVLVCCCCSYCSLVHASRQALVWHTLWVWRQLR